jgi:hypothetical protein
MSDEPSGNRGDGPGRRNQEPQFNWKGFLFFALCAMLIGAGLIRAESLPLKILGDMGKEKKVGHKFTITANRVSESVRKAVTEAGGSVNETGSRKDMVRGIDRNSDDRSPKNLTKKLKRSKPKAPPKIEDLDEKAEKPAKGEKPAKAAPEKAAGAE